MSNNISVISTILNEEKSIESLIQSLLNQSIQPDEIIIVDGGSTDRTCEILEKLSQKNKRLKVIIDPTCSLKYSNGPIARGRNIAIKNSNNSIIVCADAGCVYKNDWLDEITTPLKEFDFSFGGACVEEKNITSWDFAAAPFLGFDLATKNMHRSPTGTARSLGFHKYVWDESGGFPETSLLGEDTEFFIKINEKFKGYFADKAPAYYKPDYDCFSAMTRLARYAQSDGMKFITKKRILFMLCRIFIFIFALMNIHNTFIPILFYFLLEIILAFRFDVRSFRYLKYLKIIPLRLFFSMCVPWIFSINYLTGFLLKKNQLNEQNL